MQAQAIALIDDLAPRCIVQRPTRTLHEKRQLSKAEEGWLNLQPFFAKPVEPGLVAPHGSAKPLEGLGRFLDRIEEIRALAKTQFNELPTLAQEFKANGLTAVSLSSSPDDDDLEAANIAEQHLHRTPFSPDPETLAALLRRIDWERYTLSCSQSTRIYAKVKEDGSMTLATNDRRWSADQLAAFGPKVKALIAGRSGAELQNDRERAAFYGKPVLAAMTPEQVAAYHAKPNFYLDCADDNLSRESFTDEPQQATGGPQELGLHNLDIDLGEDGDFQYAVRYEPSEFEFWPPELDEFAS